MRKFIQTRTKSQWASLGTALISAAFLYFLWSNVWEKRNIGLVIVNIVATVAALLVFKWYVEMKERNRK